MTNLGAKDLFLITPQEVEELMNDYANDLEVLGLLVELDNAIQAGDDWARIEAIEGLTQELVLRRGIWE